MATFATNTNLSHMNAKQLRKIAKDVGVTSTTIDAVLSENSKSGKSALVTAIKAK